MADNQPSESFTKHQKIAIGIIVIILAITAYSAPYIYKSITENSDLWYPRTFDIVFSQNFNNQVGYLVHPDMEIGLTIRHPRATLAVDDPVNVSGKAIIYNQTDVIVESVTIHFQNAQEFPITHNINGITKGIDLYLHPTQNKSVLTGNATMSWALEGKYYPMGAYIFKNRTGRYQKPPGISSDVAITVYPKTDLAQIVANDAILYSTIAIYFLTIVGVINLLFYLWHFSPPPRPRNNNNNKTESNGKPHTDNNKSHRWIAKANQESYKHKKYKNTK